MPHPDRGVEQDNIMIQPQESQAEYEVRIYKTILDLFNRLGVISSDEIKSAMRYGEGAVIQYREFEFDLPNQDGTVSQDFSPTPRIQCQCGNMIVPVIPLLEPKRPTLVRCPCGRPYSIKFIARK